MSENFKPYLALEASAGSGKTFALSVRYLSLLFLGASPQKIVALTFTNKSAAEMKQRIFETLKNLESKDELDAISHQIGKSREAVLAQKDSVMQALLQADIKISTLDAFFGGILRQFALHVGLMPDFKTDHTGLYDEVLERFLKQSQNANLYQALIAFSLNENKKLGDIFALLDRLYQKKGEFDITSIERCAYISPLVVFDVLIQIKNAFELLGLGSRGLKTFESDSIEKLMKSGFLSHDDFGYWDYKKYANDETNALLERLKRTLHAYFEAKEAYFLGEMGKLFELYDRALLQVSKEFSQLSFTDVTNRLYTLLQKEIAKDFLYFRLDGAIEHLLIDEFQDTSVLQYKILEPIIEEIRSGIGVKSFKTLFFVGDVKQSIYRFRGGAKELFGHVKEKLSLHVETLDTNYRSTKNIVEFVNHLFVDKIASYEPQKVAKSGDEGFVQVIKSDEVEKSVIASVERLLQRGVKPHDIALLVHTNKDANTMKELIQEHFEHLHVRLEASLRLVEVKSVKAIIYCVKYLYFKEKIYLAHFLTLIGHSWNDKLETQSFDIGVTPLDLVVKIVDTFNLFEQSVDVLKFLEVARRFEDIESFLFAIEELSDEAKSEDRDGLRVLTVHKSKGLEFEHVILIDKFTKENNKSDTILYEYNDINISGVYLNMSGREHVDKVYANAKEKEKILSSEDRLNKLYVAFTRAKSSLFVCVKEDDSAFDALELSSFEIGTISSKVQASKEEPSKVLVHIPHKYGAQEVVSSNEETELSDMQAISFGIAMHYMLEMLYSFHPTSLPDAYTTLTNRYTKLLDEKALGDIYRRVEILLDTQAFLALLEGAICYKEQPLFYQEARYQIDLMLEYKDKIVVIDYKSSRAQSEKHQAQVAKYQEALHQISGMRVEGYICYLGSERSELVKSLYNT